MIVTAALLHSTGLLQDAFVPLVPHCFRVLQEREPVLGHFEVRWFRVAVERVVEDEILYLRWFVAVPSV